MKTGPCAGTPTASTTTSIVSTVNSQHRVVASPRVSAPMVVTQSRVPTVQQTGIVSLPGGQQVNTPPVLVNTAMSSAGGHHIRHSAPRIQTRPPLAGGHNVVINQSGSQISVPLQVLKTLLQAGKFFCQVFFG